MTRMSLLEALSVISERLEATPPRQISADLDESWLRTRLLTSLFEARAAAGRSEPFLHGDERVLEVGAGLGLFSAALAMAGHDVVALEPAGPGFDTHRDLTPAIREELGVDYELLPLPAEELRPEDQGRFDLILSTNVLEHVPDVSETLGRLDACLAPGAVMVHTCPNYRVPFEPHLGIPLVPIRPAATGRLLPPSIRDTGLWESLNFVTAQQVEDLASDLDAELCFQPAELATALGRLSTDEMFRARHAWLARVVPVLDRLGVSAVLARLPPRWSTPMTFEWRGSRTR